MSRLSIGKKFIALATIPALYIKGGTEYDIAGADGHGLYFHDDSGDRNYAMNNATPEYQEGALRLLGHGVGYQLID